VKSLPGVFRQLNDNFVVLTIEGVMNMSSLHQLVASSYASIVEDNSVEVQKFVGRLVR
jgi:hypothetical protein